MNRIQLQARFKVLNRLDAANGNSDASGTGIRFCEPDLAPAWLENTAAGFTSHAHQHAVQQTCNCLM